MALVDGDVTAHEGRCNTAHPSTGGELVTWTLDLQHEFYIHAMRIYNTGCGELENELLSLTPVLHCWQKIQIQTRLLPVRSFASNYNSSQALIFMLKRKGSCIWGFCVIVTFKYMTCYVNLSFFLYR